MPAEKMLVLQSGGPTRVINRSLYGVVSEGRNCIAREGVFNRGIYGSVHGVKGILEQDFVDLTNIDPAKLEAVGRTPASALGTTRYELMEGGKVKEADIDRAIKVLRAHNIGFLFPIGGGDSAETALLLNQGADERGYRLRVMHVPKTVDNDLMGTERCPGYISAAAFIINYLLGTYFDAQSNGETIDLNVVMGRNAGWLAASAAYCGKGWHVPLIITPENPVPVEAFIELAARAYKESGGVLQVVVSEGARDDKGEWGKQLAEEMGIEARTDTTGRAVLSDIPLANLLAPKLKKATGARVVADTLGYGQRSFNGAYAKSDGRDAERVGRLAVRRAAAGESGKMINIRAERDPFYTTRYGAVDLSEVAKPGEKMIREVPRYFFDKNGQPNDLFVKELEPLLDDEIPDTEMLDLDTRVKKLEL